MKIHTKELYEAVHACSRIIPGRLSLPILSMVRLEATGGKLSITAGNLDCCLIRTVDCEGDLQPICANTSRLLALLGGTEQVELLPEKDQLRVLGGDTSAHLPTLSGDEFPANISGEWKPAGISASDVADGIDAVKWSASDDHSRFVLNSVLVESKDGELNVLAISGRTLSMQTRPTDAKPLSVVIPIGMAAFFSAACRTPEAKIFVCENAARVEAPGGTFTTKLVDDEYPNYRQVIPNNLTRIATVTGEELKATIKTAAQFTSDREYHIYLKFSGKELVVSSRSEANGAFRKSIPAKCHADAEFAFDQKYLIPALVDGELRLESQDEHFHLVIKTRDLLTIVMPLRKS